MAAITSGDPLSSADPAVLFATLLPAWVAEGKTEAEIDALKAEWLHLYPDMDERRAFERSGSVPATETPSEGEPTP